MKTNIKKKGQMGTLGKAILILVFLAIVFFTLFPAIKNKLSGVQDILPQDQEGCRQRLYYSDFIKISYNQSDYRKGLELYVEFQECYPGEQITGVPENILSFYKLEEADLYLRQGDVAKAQENARDSLQKYLNQLNADKANTTAAAFDLEKINGIYDFLIRTEQASQNKTLINKSIEEKLASLAYIHNTAFREKSRIPLDLIMVYLGDTYLSGYYYLNEDQFYLASFYYRKAVTTYPKANNASGQGFYSPLAEDRIVELARILDRDVEPPRSSEAVELCYWLNSNYITENGKTRAHSCLDYHTSRYACSLDIINRDGTTTSKITDSCDDYRLEYFCLSNPCKISSRCNWSNGMCIAASIA
jgi:tetratricopeptide (TPR) repeat protein